MCACGLDGCQSLAKVEVAGSNPVVRSRNLRSRLRTATAWDFIALRCVSTIRPGYVRLTHSQRCISTVGPSQDQRCVRELERTCGILSAGSGLPKR